MAGKLLRWTLLCCVLLMLPLTALAHTDTAADAVMTACLETLGAEWTICSDEEGEALFCNGGSCAVAFVTDGVRVSLAWFERVYDDWKDWWHIGEPLFGVEGLIPAGLDLYEENGALFIDCTLNWDEKKLRITAQQDYYPGYGDWYVLEHTVFVPADGWGTEEEWVYLTTWHDTPPLLEVFSPVAQEQEPVVIEGNKLVHYPESRIDAHYTVPDGVEIIGEHAFSENYNLVHVTLPESVRVIEDCAFCACWNLRRVDMPSRLDYLGESAFMQTYVNCVIPEGITELPDAVFCYAWMEGAVVIPEGVTDIGWECFAFGYDITDMYLPASLETIGGQTFQQGATFWDIWGFNSVDAGETHMTVHAPVGTEAARFAMWSGEAYVIEDAREGTDLAAVTGWVQAALDEALPGAKVSENEYGFPCVTYSADMVFAFATKERASRYDRDKHFLLCFDRNGNELILRWVNGDSGMTIPLEMTLVGDRLYLMLRLGEETAASLTFSGEDFRLSQTSACVWVKDTGGPPPFWSTMLALPVKDGVPLQNFTTREYAPRENVVQGAVFDGESVLLSLYDVITAAGLDYTYEHYTEGIAHFDVGDLTCVLDERHMTLTLEDDEEQFNLILPAPGSTDFRSEIIDGRWMVDADTVYCTFRSFLGWPIRINIDHDAQTVTVCAE